VAAEVGPLVSSLKASTAEVRSAAELLLTEIPAAVSSFAAAGGGGGGGMAGAPSLVGPGGHCSSRHQRLSNAIVGQPTHFEPLSCRYCHQYLKGYDERGPRDVLPLAGSEPHVASASSWTQTAHFESLSLELHGII